MKRSVSFLAVLLGSTTLSVHAFADRQAVPINYDALSFFEEPLAVEVGPATLSANMLVDQAAQYNWTSEDDEYNTRANADVLLATQLPNSWRASINYVANYNRLADEEYTDNVALSLSDAWGVLAGGNVTESVREKTRRARGVGNAELANDNFFGALEEAGGFYSVRFNSYEVSVAADGEGRAEAGLAFERPIGKANYFLSARVRKGDTSEGSALDAEAETLGGAVVAEYSYASWQLDAQAGYESIDLEDAGDENDHMFGSLGVQYKFGAYSFSAEGGIGAYDGEDRHAFALGSRVDVARGFSVNLGLNHKEVDEEEDTTALASGRYEF
ncbi:MAG: hypothetical protein AAGB03_07110 [Pseudomonadota bacterium]